MLERTPMNEKSTATAILRYGLVIAHKTE